LFTKIGDESVVAHVGWKTDPEHITGLGSDDEDAETLADERDGSPASFFMFLSIIFRTN